MFSILYKCKKVRNFFGIFALNFFEVWRFFSLQKPAFLFPAEKRRQLRFAMPRSYLLHEASRILGYLRIFQLMTFFLFCLENDIKRENKMPLPAQKTFSFWRKPKFEQKIVATDQERLKSSGISGLSSISNIKNYSSKSAMQLLKYIKVSKS